MSDFAWHPASPADESSLLALMAAFYAEDGLVFAAAEARAALRELLTTPAFGQVFGLRDSAGNLHGYALLTVGFSVEFHGRFALLDELYLDPPTRGRGYGRRALDQAADWARAAGIATLRLEVNRANTHARAFYLAAGFSDDRRDLLTRRL